VITLKVYADESADETGSRVFTVAAVVGTDDEWAEAMRHWLRRTRGLPFHANKCEFQHAKTDPSKHEENLALYRDLTTILVESHLVGLAVSLDLQSRAQCMPEVPAGIGYHKCFMDVLLNLGQIARKFNEDPNESQDAHLEFIFASRAESDGAAGTVYSMFRELPEWADTSIFGGNISFERAALEPRLEVADLLAREAMKELDRKISQARREPRKSFQALNAAGKFVLIERDRAYCEQWRDRVNSEQSQADREDYKKWLVATKRIQNRKPHDNLTNRALFYGWLENRDARAKRGVADKAAGRGPAKSDKGN
jgi:hypothetical protein